MNLNGKQVIAIIIAILGVLIGSTAQLTDLFGASTAKTVISLAGIMNSMLSSILAVITSQAAQVKDVLAMPGVDKIEINAKANKTLATIAVDPSVDKIAPTPEAFDKVSETANP
jgi:hypothetical protein